MSSLLSAWYLRDHRATARFLGMFPQNRPSAELSMAHPTLPLTLVTAAGCACCSAQTAERSTSAARQAMNDWPSSHLALVPVTSVNVSAIWSHVSTSS